MELVLVAVFFFGTTWCAPMRLIFHSLEDPGAKINIPLTSRTLLLVGCRHSFRFAALRAMSLLFCQSCGSLWGKLLLLQLEVKICGSHKLAWLLRMLVKVVVFVFVFVCVCGK